MKAAAASIGLLAAFVAATVAALIMGTSLRPNNVAPLDALSVLLLVGFSAFAVVGAFLVWRVPSNSIGWLFLVGSVAYAVVAVLQEVVRTNQASASPWVLYTSESLFFLGLSLLMVVPAIFPTGRFLSRRWTWVGGLFGLGIALGQVWTWMRPCTNLVLEFPDAETLQPDCVQPVEAWFVRFPNPLGFTNVSTEGVWMAVGAVGGLLLVIAAVAGGVSVFVRYRRGATVVRAQLRWLVAVLAVLLPVWLVLIIIDLSAADSSGGSFSEWLALGAYLIALVGIPLAIGIAITKYRLYDIDVVISKTVTYGVLAAFITVVYAAIVVGVGSLVGGGDEPSLALSITAVAVVAVAFEPVRRRVQHWANLVVYGKRATPYEVLASATARLSDTSDPDEALARVAQLVVDGTGALEAVLWLKVGDVMYPRASSPEGVAAGLGPATGDDPVGLIPGDRVVAVRHRGDVLGALSISKGRGDAVTGPDEKVLGDVAAGAGVLLRNMGLNAELAERAEQLRVSRRRLVAAQDAERRRLERDLHDGAQQQVVALKVKLGIARTLAEREGAESVAGLVASLSDTTQEAVDGMRAVAHGIYPPLLEAEGLEAALASARRTIAIAVDFAAERIVRYDRSVEESIYFCVLGVVAEAADAGATRVTVRLHGGPDAVRFSVDADSAVGDLVAVEDRVDALNGTVHIDRGTGRTVVAGELPARSRSLEPA